MEKFQFSSFRFQKRWMGRIKRKFLVQIGYFWFVVFLLAALGVWELQKASGTFLIMGICLQALSWYCSQYFRGF